MKTTLVLLVCCLCSWQSIYSQDTLGGIMWFPAVQLSGEIPDGGAYHPHIAVTGEDTVHVIWTEQYAVHWQPYIRSTDGGKTWEPIRDLIQDIPSYPGIYGYNSISTEKQRVVIFGGGEPMSPEGDGNRLTMLVSQDAGTTWAHEERFGQDTAAWLTCSDIKGDTFIVVYSPQNGQYPRPEMGIVSTNAGSSWNKLSDTLKFWSLATLTGTSMHFIKNMVVDTADEVQYLRSRDLGQTYDKTEMLSDLDGMEDAERAMASESTDSGSTIAVAWRGFDDCAGVLFGCAIYVRESTDDGETWSPQETYTDNPDGYEPAISVKGKMRAVAWNQDSPDAWLHGIAAVRIKRSDGTLTPIKRLGYGGQPNIALTTHAVHVVWYDYTPDDFTWYKTYYSRGVFLEYIKRVEYESGWNLISTSHRPRVVTTLPSLFSYAGTYVREQSLAVGKGYWAKPESVVYYEGDPVYADTIDVKKGWNIVGALTEPVDVSTVSSEPAGIVASSFFGYSGHAYHEASSLEPGRGFWVKVTQDGSLILQSNPVR